MRENEDKLSLPKRVALLTGATQGIGLSCAHHLGKDGYHVVVSSRRESNVTAAVRKLHAAGCAASGIACHAAHVSSRRLLLEHAKSQGLVAALVLCAATSPAFGPAIEAAGKPFDKMWQVNVRAQLDMIREARDAKLLADDATIVLVGSIGGYAPMPNIGLYSVTKTAVHALVRVLGEELAPIRVVGVAPGLVRTEFSSPLWRNPQDENRILKSIPLRRLGTPNDVGAVVAFLCSKGAAYITAETIIVAGGARSRL